MGDSSETLFLETAVARGYLDRALADRALSVQQAAREEGRARPSLQKIVLDERWMTPEQVSEVITEIEGGAQRAGRIEGYSVLSRIGRGGMGTVYKAVREATGETVALKILPRKMARRPDFVERFLRESRAVSKIDCDHIVKPVDGGFSGGYYYFAMEFVEGESVDTTLSIDGAMSESRAIGIVHQVALALRSAESAGLIHRDIKPGNILVREDGVAKLTDFGVAHDVAEEPPGRNGLTLGTPNYMSPEQATGRPLDIRSDVYSLGVTFYYMVTGTVPFKGETSQLTLLKHLNEQPVAPITRRPELSRGCNDVILKMLAKKSEDRYRNADELVHDLESLMEGRPLDFAQPAQASADRRPIPASEPSGQFAAEMRTSRRVRWLRTAAALLLLAVVALVVCLLLTRA